MNVANSHNNNNANNQHTVYTWGDMLTPTYWRASWYRLSLLDWICMVATFVFAQLFADLVNPYQQFIFPNDPKLSYPQEVIFFWGCFFCFLFSFSSVLLFFNAI